MRAADNWLIARLLETMSRNLGLAFALPRSRFSSTKLTSHTTARPAAMTAIAGAQPTVVSSAPPKKKPTPMSAFFEPGCEATQRYSPPCCQLGTSRSNLLFRKECVGGEQG